MTDEKNYCHGEVDGHLGSVSGATRQTSIRFQLDHQSGDIREIRRQYRMDWDGWALTRPKQLER